MGFDSLLQLLAIRKKSPPLLRCFKKQLSYLYCKYINIDNVNFDFLLLLLQTLTPLTSAFRLENA